MSLVPISTGFFFFATNVIKPWMLCFHKRNMNFYGYGDWKSWGNAVPLMREHGGVYLSSVCGLVCFSLFLSLPEKKKNGILLAGHHIKIGRFECLISVHSFRWSLRCHTEPPSFVREWKSDWIGVTEKWEIHIYPLLICFVAIYLPAIKIERCQALIWVFYRY